MTRFVFCIVSFVSLTPALAVPIGYFDSVSVTSVYGWACDTADFTQFVTIKLYATMTPGTGDCHFQGADYVCFIGSGAADQQREPAVGAQCGGYSQHGFNISTPGYVVDGAGTYRIYAYAYAPTYLLPGSPLSLTSSLQSTTYLWTQPTIGPSDIDSHILVVRPSGCGPSSPLTQGQTYVVFNFNNCTTSVNPITWAVGDFTDFYPPLPVSNYQRGVSNSWYGSEAVQMQADVIGIHNHPESAGPQIGLNTMAIAYTQPDWIRPWAVTTRNRLRYSGLFTTPRAAITSPTDGVYWGLVLKFNDINIPSNAVWVDVGIFDFQSPGSFYDFAAIDSNTGLPILSSFVGGSSRFVTAVGNSWPSTPSTWTGWRFYAFDIHGDQFAYALRYMNAQLHLNYSTNPADYVLNHLNVTDEIYFASTITSAWESAAFKSMLLQFLVFQ